MPAGCGLGLECAHVAPEFPGVDAYRLISLNDENSVAKDASHAVERLAQGVARTDVIEIGPEERGEAVPSMQPGLANCQVGQQRRVLGVRKQRVEVRLLAISQLRRAEESKVEHFAKVCPVARVGHCHGNPKNFSRLFPREYDGKSKGRQGM